MGIDLSVGRTWFSVPLSRSCAGKSSLAEEEENQSVWLGHKRPCELAFCREQLDSPGAGSEPVPLELGAGGDL